MNPDISIILREWPFDPEKTARKITGLDGREKIQLRVRIGSYDGIVQFECDGRPDGARPHDREFALDRYEEAAKEADLQGRSYALDAEQAQELFAESSMVYERYVILLSMGEFDRVIRDTERNMRLFRFVRDHAEQEEDRNNLEKWWPYVLRIHGLARIEKAMTARDFASAFKALREARRAVEALAEQDDETFQGERKRSLDAFAGIEKRLARERPRDLVEQLEMEKEDAVRRQDYERAADLRDRIRALRGARGENKGPVAAV